MDRLPSPDALPAVTKEQVAELELVMAAADRMLRTTPEFFRRKYDGPLGLVPPEDPVRQATPESPLPDNVVPITAAPSYQPPGQPTRGELVDTGQHHMAEAARAEIRQLHALASPDLTLEALNDTGQRAA